MDFGSVPFRPTMGGQPSSSRAVSHAPSKAEPSSSVQPEEEHNRAQFPSSTPAPSDVPTKRRRISNGAEALGACTRHPQHWYADGSVVIRLKNTLFRVHSSRLATKSTFFSSLFERAPHGMYDVEEGVTCPVYHIVGVKPRDFDMLLTILDDPSEYMQADLPFKTLASILRATSVLEYAKLFRWACTLLEALWPLDLSAFSTDPLPYASQTIVLARECGIASVRKRAYYELLRLPGFGQSPTAGDNKLTVEDYECLTCAREGCAEVWMGAVMRPPVEREQCANRTKNCLSNDPVRAFATYCATTRPLAKTFRHDPVAGFDELAEMPWRAGKEAWCRNCVKEWLEAWKREREELWRNLDMWLGLTT